LPAFGFVLAAVFFAVVFFIVHLASSMETDADWQSTVAAAPGNDNTLSTVVHNALPLQANVIRQLSI
jgi:hypothetical protein